MLNSLLYSILDINKMELENSIDVNFRDIFKSWLIDIFSTILNLIEYYLGVFGYIHYNHIRSKFQTYAEKEIFKNKKLQIYWIYTLLYVCNQCNIYIVNKNTVIVNDESRCIS